MLKVSVLIFPYTLIETDLIVFFLNLHQFFDVNAIYYYFYVKFDGIDLT